MKAIIKLVREITIDNKEWIVVEARGQQGVLHSTTSFYPHQIADAEALFDKLVENVSKWGFGPYRTDIKVVEIEN